MKNIKEKFEYLFDIIRYFFVKIFSSRAAILLTVLVVLFSILSARVFYLQIIKSDYYVENFTQKAQKVITTAAARGNIYDCNGNLLAYNELSYNVTLTDEIPSSDTRGDTLNAIIYKAIRIIEKYGDSIIDDFNIEINGRNEYAFKENPQTKQTTFLVNIFGVTTDELAEEGYDKYTAQQIMDELIDRYGVSEVYSMKETLKIVTIRYALSLTAYQKYVSTIIAKDVNQQTMSAILETTENLTGVDVAETYKRKYIDSEYFAHIIGYTGEISEEELEEYNLENATGITYSMGDYVGKSGIEQTYDAYLQGTKGTKTVFVDNTGNILEVIEETQSVSGNDIYLSIDRDLQVAGTDIFEKKLAACLINKIVDYETTAATKQTYVYIPIKSVYAQILTNVIDITEFEDKDASEREQATLKAFEKKKKEVMAWIKSELYNDSAVATSELPSDQNEYINYVYSMLKEIGIIDANLIDEKDTTYLAWAEDSISLREFLQHAISENWIDVAEIEFDVKYSKSDEIYDAIINTAFETMEDSRNFAEKVYYYMVYNGDLDPYDICLMLYDQDRIPMDDLYDHLVNKTIDTYTYVLEEIESLSLTPAMLALDPCSGGFCMTDIDTGKVKCLISYPTYDNNKLSGAVDTEYWYRLNINDSQPLFNYSTCALTAPGSTFKIVTAVAGLSEGFITPQTVIYDNVIFTEVTPSPRCYVYPGSHGNEDLAGAIRDSCNYFFFQIGYDMGLDEQGDYVSAQALDIIEDYAIALGLGVKSGVENGEISPRVSTTDSVRTAIGQGTNGYATVHMARYVNTIANRGKNYQLSLINKVVDGNGKSVINTNPVLTNTVELSTEEWDAIHYGMRMVCTDGTARLFFGDVGPTVAGKTGTAEENLYRSNHATFIGFSPYEDPEISFACMIRNVDSTSYPGGITSEILQYYYGQDSLEEVLSRGVVNNISGFHSE